MPNQPKTPIYGFRYPRKGKLHELVARWGGGKGMLTEIGIVAMDEFLAKYGDATNPPPAMHPREERGDDE